MDIADIRQFMSGLDGYAYFATSAHSAKLAPVVEEAVRVLRLHSQGPVLPWVSAAIAPVFEEARAALARALNADVDEIAICEHTTYGILQIATGIEWQPGDTVIISTHEHPANRVPWYSMAQRFGARLRYITPREDYGTFLDGMIDNRTRIVSLNHLSNRTGLRLPAREIADIAHRHGVPVLLDGAQAFGAVPVDMKALDCDFYAFSGHKYLLAPQGTGGLFVRSDRLDWLKSIWVATHSVQDVQNLDEAGHMCLLPSARRFEFGTRNVADKAGLRKALEIWEALGWNVVFDYIRVYTDRMKASLQSLPGLVLETPLPYAKSSAIVVFHIPGMDGNKLTQSLLEHEKVVATPGGLHDGVRISTHVFNTDEEIDRLVSGLRRILDSGY
jgi:selenocysteine lyase/cysteine desulfurase